MKLTSYTDYALRTLIFLGKNRDQLVTIQDIAEIHGISKNHLMKVAHQLGVTGMIDTVRGRNGGLRLKLEPEQINLGDVVRNTETDFYMAECFDPSNVSCAYSSSCALKGILHTATAAYLKVLDGVTLADLLLQSGPEGKAETKISPVRLHPRPAPAKH